MFAAAQCFRYSVTGNKTAGEIATVNFNGLELLQNVTGVTGRVFRFLYPISGDIFTPICLHQNFCFFDTNFLHQFFLYQFFYTKIFYFFTPKFLIFLHQILKFRKRFFLQKTWYKKICVKKMV